ncbi:MAG TPA: hypothetical protein VD884_11455 [Ohtaekwangia sp.]|nr:hypothetical protein [Ohtaekwangia sp.]
MSKHQPTPAIEVVSYLTMRKTIGWLGMLLPFLLLTGNLILNNTGLFNSDWFVQLHDKYAYENEGSFKSSVSHYYYTTMGEIFTGTLLAVAIFMFCYTGHPKRPEDKGFSDNTMTNLAGIFALGVVAFPTTSEAVMKDNLRSFISSDTVGWIHYGFAALFFIVLATMSMVNFRRAQDPELFGKGDDDPFFFRCGIVMLACLVLVPILSMVPKVNLYSTFALEAIALIAFGSSWLKKGKADFAYLPRKLNLSGTSPEKQTKQEAAKIG